MSEDNRDKKDGAVGLAGALHGAATAAPQAAGADAMRRGMDLFLGEAKRLTNLDIEFKKGNLFEFIEAAKFNMDAAMNRSRLSADVTAANGDPTGAADILVRGRDGGIVRVQAKVSRSSTYMARALSEGKYEGMYKLVPRDKAGSVGRLAEGLSNRTGQRGESIARQYADTARGVRGELQVGDVRSGGTDLEETLEAARAPRRYAFYRKTEAIVEEALTAGSRAAVASGILGGAISLAQNSLAVTREELSGREAALQVAQDTARAAVKGGATATLGTMVRHTTRLPGLAKSNVATAIASGLIDAGVAVYSFVKGEMTPVDLAHALGQNGCSTLSGLYGGAIAGAALGPLGALLGSVAGYLLAANTYQSSLAILRHAQLVEEEAARAIALREEAHQRFVENKQAFEHWIAKQLGERDRAFKEAFATIDAGLAHDDPKRAVAGLSDLAAMFGHQLGFARFEEFDAFMTNTDAPLVL